MADQCPTQVSLQVIETGAGKKLVQARKITWYGNVERLHRRCMRSTQKANKVELRRAAVKFRQFRFVVEVGGIAPLHRAQGDTGERCFKLEYLRRILRRLRLGFSKQLEYTRDVGLVLLTQLNGLIILAFVVPLFR